MSRRFSRIFVASWKNNLVLHPPLRGGISKVVTRNRSRIRYAMISKISRPSRSRCKLANYVTLPRLYLFQRMETLRLYPVAPVSKIKDEQRRFLGNYACTCISDRVHNGRVDLDKIYSVSFPRSRGAKAINRRYYVWRYAINVGHCWRVGDETSHIANLYDTRVHVYNDYASLSRINSRDNVLRSSHSNAVRLISQVAPERNRDCSSCSSLTTVFSLVKISRYREIKVTGREKE